MPNPLAAEVPLLPFGLDPFLEWLDIQPNVMFVRISGTSLLFPVFLQKRNRIVEFIARRIGHGGNRPSLVWR
jgi:hypothetical protein